MEQSFHRPIVFSCFPQFKPNCDTTNMPKSNNSNTLHNYAPQQQSAPPQASIPNSQEKPTSKTAANKQTTNQQNPIKKRKKNERKEKKKPQKIGETSILVHSMASQPEAPSIGASESRREVDRARGLEEAIEEVRSQPEKEERDRIIAVGVTCRKRKEKKKKDDETTTILLFAPSFLIYAALSPHSNFLRNCKIQTLKFKI